MIPGNSIYLCIVRVVGRDPGSNLTPLELLVDSGQAALLETVLSINGTYFSQGTLTAMVARAREHEAENPEMFRYVRSLEDWDKACEIAKNNLGCAQVELWASLRSHPDWCYKVPPTRRWSIAMQVLRTTVALTDIARMLNLISGGLFWERRLFAIYVECGSAT